MPPAGTPPTLEQAVRTCQILLVALAMGLAMFVGVTIYLTINGAVVASGSGGGGNHALGMQLTAIGVFFLLGGVFAGLVMRRATIARARKDAAEAPSVEDGERVIVGAFTTQLILRGALAEGPGLLCTVALLVSGWWPALVGSIGGVIALVALFPTRARFEAFSADVLDDVETAR